MSLLDSARTDDAAQAAAAQRGGEPAARRHPREDARRVADLRLGGLSRHGARLRARPRRDGLQARRQALGGRRQPAAALYGAARGAGAGRHRRCRSTRIRSPSELVYVLNHAETSVIVAEDQEQVDKALSLKDQLPQPALDRVRRSARPVGLRRPDAAILRGRARRRARLSARPIRASTTTSSPRAGPTTSRMIAYTSGTTGSPKGVMLQPSQHDRGGRGLRRGRTTSSAGDNWLSYLPMAWVGDAAFSLGMALAGKLVAELPGEPGDGAARPARARARRDAGAAAHLGEHADRDAGQGRRRHAAQAPRVRAISAAWPSAAS